MLKDRILFVLVVVLMLSLIYGVRAHHFHPVPIPNTKSGFYALGYCMKVVNSDKAIHLSNECIQAIHNWINGVSNITPVPMKKEQKLKKPKKYKNKEVFYYEIS